MRFTLNNETDERLLFPLDDNGKKLNNVRDSSSWLFSDEPLPEEDVSSDCHSASTTNNVSFHHQNPNISPPNKKGAPSSRVSKEFSVAKTVSRIGKCQRRSSRRTVHSSDDYMLPDSDASPSPKNAQNSVQMSTFRARISKERRAARKTNNQDVFPQPLKTFNTRLPTIKSAHSRADSENDDAQPKVHKALLVPSGSNIEQISMSTVLL